MHPTALEGFARMLGGCELYGRPLHVLDIGGADVNGTVHDVLYREHFVELLDVMDIAPGCGVTIIADAADPGTWDLLRRERSASKGGLYDLVISTETLEHVQEWRNIVQGVVRVLRPGGWFVGTCASTGRRPHGARGEHFTPEGEWYGNVEPSELVDHLLARFGGDVVVEYSRLPEYPTTNDLYWRAQVAL